MKNILITQRHDYLADRDEWRDSLDSQWIELLYQSGFMPIVAPNHCDVVRQLLETSSINGIILTGGPSMCQYGGNSVQRDRVDALILAWAINNNIPLLGVCRGMQSLQAYFDISLTPAKDRIAVNLQFHMSQKTEHSVAWYSLLEKMSQQKAYFNWATKRSNDELSILVRDQDNWVLAVRHVAYPLFGIMWHPERDSNQQNLQKRFLRLIFKGK